MSVRQSADSYVYGDCTYGMALLYPGIAPDMGNAADWVRSARAKGYPVLQYPVPGAIVSYGAGQGYSSFGHVASVVNVFDDGTFLVKEMNYSGWNTWDERRSTMVDVQGFIVAPGSGIDVNTLLAVSDQQNCVTWQVSVLGSNICMDAFIGVLAVGAGIVLLIAGAVILAIAIQSSQAGKMGKESADAVRGAVPAARPASETKSSTEANPEVARRRETAVQAKERHQAAMRQAQLRTARARARAAERRAIAVRGGTSASTRGSAASARAKLKSGADPRSFTAAEARWIQTHQDEATKLIKGAKTT